MILNDDKITSSNASGIILDKSLVFDGSPTSPGISFLNEPSSGIYRISNGVLGIAIGGNKVAQIDSFGIQAMQPYWRIVEQQSNGTNSHNGATFSSGVWATRFLNTTIGNNTIAGSSLSSNRFTLPSGTYRIFATAPAYYVGNHKAKLINITDTSDMLLGTNERSAYVSVVDASQTSSVISGIFTITSSKIFEIQHRCQNSQGTTGFGYNASFGVPEIYTVVELWKVA